MAAILQVPASFLVLSSIFNCSLQCPQFTVITINSHLWVDNHMQTCRDAWGEVEWSEVEWSEVTQAVLGSDTAHNDNIQ